MDLTVRDAARLLNIPERQIYRWADAGEMPAHQVQGQPRFHPAELLEWATLRKLPVSPELFAGTLGAGVAAASDLARCIEAGGVHRDVPAPDRAGALRAMVDRLTLAADADRAFLLDMLLAREAVGSTAVGDGIAVPHVRSPVVVEDSQPMLAVGFLAQALAYGAFDGKPVHTLFLIVSPTVRVHLQLLAELSAALHDTRFKTAVVQRAGDDVILEAARLVGAELRLRQSSERGAERGAGKP